MESQGQLALVFLRTLRVEEGRQHKTENPVTEEFQPLIASKRPAGAGMCQGLGEKFTVTEVMAYRVLETGEIVMRPGPGQVMPPPIRE